MKLTIKSRILIGFTVTVLITAGLGAFAFLRLGQVDTAAQAITTDSLPGVDQSSHIKECMLQNYGRVFQCLLNSDHATLESIAAEMKATTEEQTSVMAEYEKTIHDNDDRAKFDAVGPTREVYMSIRKHVMELNEAGKKDEALKLAMTDMRSAFHKYCAAVDSLVTYNRDSAKDDSNDITQAVSTGKRGIVIGVGAALLASIGIAVGIGWSVNKALTRMASALGEGSGQVASAAGQVSGSSQAIAQGASEQAAALEETTSALEEMSSMTKKNAETAQQAAALSAETKVASDKGNTAMKKMASAIDEIQKSAQETAKIIKVIDEIAFQTNLLALNAAVEAARAGEAGKGFAVVAEEVRNLAMRSAEAAKNTSALIEGSVQSSRNGVAISSDVAKTLEEITAAAGKVNALVGEISAACQEQSTGIGQINTSVSQMDQVTQSNAASAEEGAAASEELSSQAEALRGVVGELLVLVRGGKTAKAAPGCEPQAAKTPAKTVAKPAAKKAHAIPLDDNEADFSDFDQKKAA